MIIELLKDIYRLEIPLPGSPLKLLNSYLIKGNDRNLLIDTGFNRPECEEALMSALNELELDFEKTDIFITHLHADHNGLVFSIKTDENTVYASEIDGNIMNYASSDMNYWTELAQSFLNSGLRGTLDEAITNHPGYRFNPGQKIDIHFLKEGDVLEVGRYKFKCLLTPGHTPGHLCLFEEKEKILFCGDCVLGDITPTVCIEQDLPMPLTLYLQSLDRLEKLEIKHAFVGHRNMLKDIYSRIKELKEHHRSRCEEVIKILKDEGPHDAYEIAAKMSWRIRAKNWDDFPPSQKWFATGEAQAHMLHLWQLGLLTRHYRENGVNYFQLKEGVASKMGD